jgi:hypothetical protein
MPFTFTVKGQTFACDRVNGRPQWSVNGVHVSVEHYLRRLREALGLTV